jgi:hypothetical protein
MRGQIGKSRAVAAGVLAVALAALLGSSAARAEAPGGVPGVGYDPQGRGLVQTLYKLDSLNNPYTSYVAVFTARPGEVGTHPNAYSLDVGDPLVRAAFELRWGPFTTSIRFKRWAGPSNEVSFIIGDALTYYYQTHPQALGGATAGRNGIPTATELIDVAAFDDVQIWQTYMKEILPGWSPERRATICDSSKPPGDGDSLDQFWGMQYYYHNTYQPPPPVSPQMPASMLCPPG